MSKLTKQPKGLGRGLNALFISDDIETKINPMSELAKIPIEQIEANPNQPRSRFDEDLLDELAESIKELGIIQPITLKATSHSRSKYIIISGERRWRASQRAGLTEIPAYIREVDDENLHAMALVENLQRTDLNPIEIAIGLQRLIEECNLSQEGLAQKVSMKRPSISNYLRLLKLGDEIQYALKRGLISMGHAKAIASIEQSEEQQELLKRCIERGISVREAERFAQSLAQQVLPKPEPRKVPSHPEFETLTNHLGEIFAKGVEIKANNRGGGKIVINFSNRSEIEQLLRELE